MQSGEFRSCRRVSCTLLSREWKSVTSLVVEMYVCVLMLCHESLVSCFVCHEFVLVL